MKKIFVFSLMTIIFLTIFSGKVMACAPNAGDGIPDGSGWGTDHGAPNAGDCDPDGSGW